jgi:hypothetical protein
MIIAIDVVALWGLCAYGSREYALDQPVPPYRCTLSGYGWVPRVTVAVAV